ncbi:hypothetical protein MVEN_00801300 [Mycena venus]|uniref:Uncharacterized protein n=1 Tax=Mycena venus TaxID=2733690 RepID=A0A8H6YMN8_9AGAR|nr:hypothetical protein MVEN_00801300 [Mycena venus]
MPPLLGVFVSSQVVGLSAAGFFLASTMGSSPFNLIPIAERSNLSPATRAPLYKHMFFVRGRRAFIGSAFGGAAAFLVAYFNRPADIALEHSRALLGAAGALLLAVLQTAIWMLPIYKALGDETHAGTEVQAKERWDSLMKRFYRGNFVRVVLYTVAYALGIYGLASSRVAALV